MAKVASFISKLHELLEYNSSPDLHWVGDDAFEINGNDMAARMALSPKFDFKSLGSFNRQLSYYDFKRLSDKRRSVERQAPSQPGFIVFAHPSRAFVRGDSSQLHQIVRKARRKIPKGTGTARRVSMVSATTSNSHSSPEESSQLLPPVPALNPSHWQVPNESFALPAIGQSRSAPAQYPQLPLPAHAQYEDRVALDASQPHYAPTHEYTSYQQPSNGNWRPQRVSGAEQHRMHLPSMPAQTYYAPSGMTAAFAISGEPSPSDSSYTASTSGSPSWRHTDIQPSPNQMSGQPTANGQAQMNPGYSSSLIANIHTLPPIVKTVQQPNVSDSSYAQLQQYYTRGPVYHQHHQHQPQQHHHHQHSQQYPQQNGNYGGHTMHAMQNHVQMTVPGQARDFV